MKRRIVLILAVMLVISVVGGKSLSAKENLVKAPIELAKKAPANSLPTTPNPGVPTQGITVNTIQFEEIRDLSQVPEPVQQLVQNHRKQRGYDFWRSEEGVYYLAVFSGKKSTGGYSVQVARIEDNEGVTNVTIEEKSPSKDAMVTMAITYPYTVVKFTGTTDQFQLFLTSGQKLTKDGETLEIISCPTGQVQVQSALDERIKTWQLIAQAWANRLREINQLLNDDSLNPEDREILVKERDFVQEEWQKALQQIQSTFRQLDQG